MIVLQVCGVSVTLYIVTVRAVVVYMVTSWLNSIAVFTMAYRTVVTTYFTIIGLQNHRSITSFYDEMLSEIDFSTRKKVCWLMKTFIINKLF
jgi:hypothetical protein